jgi:hypothetical protein
MDTILGEDSSSLASFLTFVAINCNGSEPDYSSSYWFLPAKALSTRFALVVKQISRGH